MVLELESENQHRGVVGPGSGEIYMSKRILLVEDSDTTRLSHRIMITKRTGYDVVAVANGAEALKLAAVQTPDLVLMDVMMPGMDGLEVCRRLRKQKATAEVPIVLLTFRVGEESISEGYASGCTAYLKKPILPDELVDALRQHLGE
jgi:two-component system phosphate regulon response regulator PhoB